MRLKSLPIISCSLVVSWVEIAFETAPIASWKEQDSDWDDLSAVNNLILSFLLFHTCVPSKNSCLLNGVLFNKIEIFHWLQSTYWLMVWPTNQLINLMVWPTNRLIDWWSDQPTDWLIDGLTNQPTDWLMVWSTNWLIDWWSDQPTDWLIDGLTNQPTDWLIDGLTDQPTEWLMVWPTDWLMVWLWSDQLID